MILRGTWFDRPIRKRYTPRVEPPEPRTAVLTRHPASNPFLRKLVATISLASLWLGLVVLAGGCGVFKPDEKKKDDDTTNLEPYPSPERPTWVLRMLKMAYERRDSTQYKVIYDSSYVGTSVDQNDVSTLIVSYRDELDHIAALERTPGLRAYLELGPEATWDPVPSDDPSHPDWMVILISGTSYKVQIDDTVKGDSYAAEGDAGFFQEFTFEPTPDETSPTGAYWKIIRWREVGSSAQAGGLSSRAP